MIYLYYAKVGSESAEALAKVIGKVGGQVELKRQKHGPFSYQGQDYLVNWGATCPDRGGSSGRWLNRAVSHDKLRHLQALTNLGLPTVEWAMKPGEGRWLARHLRHMDGSDLEKRVQTGDFYVKWVDVKDEYRAHIFQGEVLRFSHKRPSTKFLEPGETIDQEFKIGNGWVFSDHDYKNEVGPKMRKAAVDAVAALSYDFGGVDIAYTKDNKIVVFEVNSAPWLGGEMQRSYAERIVKLARG